MSMTANSDVVDLLNSQPRTAYIANLYTFSLLSGPVMRYTDWRRPVTIGGVTWQPTPRPVRGSTRVERGTAVSSTKVTLQEANGATIAMVARGFFRRAIFSLDRTFALPPAQGGNPVWTSHYNRFTGRVNSTDSITRSSVDFTVKCMLDDLDNDYPRDVLQPDCNAVVFDARCGLSAAAYRVSGVVAAGSTKNMLLSNLTQPDTYFTQGVVTFTGGTMSGLAYLVKNYASTVVNPAYPFLDVPAAGTAFSITPGCDNTLATCIVKYGYNPSSGAAPFHRGTPYVPDPTVTY